MSVLLGIVAVLTFLSLAGQVARFHLGLPNALGLVPFFYVDLENNLPTWYQTLALAFASVLLAGLAVAARHMRAPFAGRWLALSLLFVFLSLDEAASIHEATMEPLQRVVGYLPGVWQPVWVILGIAAVVAFAAAFLRFLLYLPRDDRWQVFWAAALFVGGAIGVEMATAALYTTSDPSYKVSFTYALLAHAEELLEMLGVVVLIDFLLRRLSRTASFSVTVAS
ncbi:hypothetical protein [Shumkonia mesophila]|uniref:hypothetical protein n=1 Tax=Shumkonia mesophila TaxID=2838854 RepID=UPI0029350B4C|nr:hypothetical protein [Shumkonia mesophila]